jgi:hypothetical protein
MTKRLLRIISLFVLGIAFIGCSTTNLKPKEAGYHFRKGLPKKYSELNYIYKDDVYLMKVIMTEEEFENYIQEFHMTPFDTNSLDVQDLLDWSSSTVIEWWNPESKIENSFIYYYVDDSPFPPYIHYAKFENGFMYLKAVMSVITIKP